MPTYPGIHSEFDITQYPGDIRPIIRIVSENFYITRSFRSASVGNSDYWAILVRPSDEFSIFINTDREILIVFAQYKTFEVRTLEAYDEFYSFLDSRRVDKSLRFLISQDHNIENKVRHYLDQHPEYPIIIPLTYEQASQRHQNPLLKAVQRNYLIRDLFGYQNPLREETFFFGRQDIVNSVFDMAKSGQNSSLFGLRKSGKTSAIYAIERKSKGFQYRTCIIDCQNPAVHARNYSSLLAFILSEIRRRLSLKKTTINLGEDLAAVAETFESQMRTILSAIKGNLLLIFDEIENISPKTAASLHWRNENDSVYFWQIIRSFIQSESNGRVSVCFVGTNPHILESAYINGIANPIYLYAKKQFIPNFSFDETREMVEKLGYYMGLEFSANIISDLHKEFGGHPFFIRQVCSRIHKSAPTSRPIKVSSTLLNSARVDFKGELEGYLREIVMNLKNFYPEEFTVLSAVVRGSNTDLTEYGRDAPDLIDHLIGYGIVERFGDEFDIRFDAIRSALERVIEHETVEDRWIEVSKRRNNLEVNIRIALFHWSKGVPREEWLYIFEQSLTTSRRQSLFSIEPIQIFSRLNSPLYFSDLIGFIKCPKVLPYLSVRRSLVLTHMDKINKLRKDAHANALTDDELREVREAFDFLEQEFFQP